MLRTPLFSTSTWTTSIGVRFTWLDTDTTSIAVIVAAIKVSYMFQ